MSKMNKYVAMMLDKAMQSEMLSKAGWGPEHAEEAANWRAGAEAVEELLEACNAMVRWGKSANFVEVRSLDEMMGDIEAALAKASGP